MSVTSIKLKFSSKGKFGVGVGRGGMNFLVSKLGKPVLLLHNLRVQYWNLSVNRGMLFRVSQETIWFIHDYQISKIAFCQWMIESNVITEKKYDGKLRWPQVRY